MSYIRVMKNLSIILKSAAFAAAVCFWFPSAGQNPVHFVSKVACIDSLRVAAAEGIVLKYHGRTIKLTGSFAAVNQILGMQKYDRKK